MDFLKILFQLLILVSPLLKDFWQFHIIDRAKEEIYSLEAFKESLDKVSQKWKSILSNSLSKENLNIVISAIFISLLFFSPYLFLLSYIVDAILLKSYQNSFLPDSFVGQSFLSLFGAKVVSYAKKSLLNLWSKEAIFIRHIGHHSRKNLVYTICIFFVSVFVMEFFLYSRDRNDNNDLIFLTIFIIIGTYLYFSVSSMIQALNASKTITYTHKVTDISTKKQIESTYNELFVLFNAPNPYILEQRRKRLILRDSWLRFEYLLTFHERENKLYIWGSDQILKDTFATLSEVEVESSDSSTAYPVSFESSLEQEASSHNIPTHSEDQSITIIQPSLMYLPIVLGLPYGVFMGAFIVADGKDIGKAIIVALFLGGFFGICMTLFMKYNFSKHSKLPTELAQNKIIFGGFASGNGKKMGSLWVSATHIYFKAPKADILVIERSVDEQVANTSTLPFMATVITITNNSESHKFSVMDKKEWITLFQTYPYEPTDNV